MRRAGKNFKKKLDEQILLKLDRAKFIRNIYFRYINGTWIRRKFETDAGSTRDTGLPDLNGRFGLRYEKNLEIVSALWGDFFVRAASDADEEDLSAGTVEHFDGWGTLNIALGVDLGKRSQYKLSLELNNLLDKEYTPATETLMAAERHVVVKLSTTF